MRKLLTLLALSLLSLAANAQTTVTIGENTADDFAGSTANNLAENAATSVQGGDLDIGKYSSGNSRMGVIRFAGLSNLPAGLTVTSATVFGYLHTAGGDMMASHTFTARRLLRDWVRAEATWNIYSTGNSWTTAGAQSAGNDRSSTITGTSEAIPMTIGVYYDLIADSAQLRADVEDMVDNAGSNFGWTIERTDAANDFEYRVFGGTAVTDGQRIYLEVTYTEAAGGATIPIISHNRRMRAQ